MLLSPRDVDNRREDARECSTGENQWKYLRAFELRGLLSTMPRAKVIESDAGISAGTSKN
jgi:hypothetical protein